LLAIVFSDSLKPSLNLIHVHIQNVIQTEVGKLGKTNDGGIIYL